MENARRPAERTLHLDPVAEIIAHVIAAERQHSHGIAAYLADFPACCGGHLRAHSGADVDPRAPIKSLVDERNRTGTTAAENDGADRHSLGVLPSIVDRRTLRSRSGKARIRMGCLGAR